MTKLRYGTLIVYNTHIECARKNEQNANKICTHAKLTRDGFRPGDVPVAPIRRSAIPAGHRASPATLASSPGLQVTGGVQAERVAVRHHY